MCLSTLYRVKGDEKELILRNVVNITIEEGKWVFVDIMGRKMACSAELEQINLKDNYISIRAPKEESR